MKRMILLLFLLVSLVSFSQNRESKWVVSINGSFINFGIGAQNSALGQQFNVQTPKINVTRYLFKELP